MGHDRIEDHRMPGQRHIVVYTDDHGQGGVAIYNHAILCGLVQAGYRASCIQSPSENPMIARQKELGVGHYFLPFDTRQDGNRGILNFTDAVEAFNATRPDAVVFSNSSPFSHIAAKTVAIQAALPFIIVEGYVVPRKEVPPPLAQFFPHLGHHYRQAKAVIAVSHDNLHLLHDYGLPADRGRIIHYGRPPSYFEAPKLETRQRLRREFGIPDRAMLCLTTARLEPVKGHPLLLEALYRLRNTEVWPQLYFAWLGSGTLELPLRDALRNAYLTNHVRVLGHRWDVIDWLDASDAFVLPTYYEGMPLSIMEAMAKGLPVLASAVSGIPEELGNTGKLIPSPLMDPQATVHEITSTLVLWASKPELRSTIGKACRQRALDLFQEERMVRQTIQLIEGACLSRPESIRPTYPASSPSGRPVSAG
jgi:glycosyltransferase involved in cell wall biosynthesis